MKITQKSEVLDILRMPYGVFENTVKKEARKVQRIDNADHIVVTSLLGYDNICKNRCTYCGMRAGFIGLKRYRMDIGDIKRSEDEVKKLGISRIFLISGEDPKYDFGDILSMVTYGKQLGLFVSLAAGEMSCSRYRALEAAGLDEYVLKFETSSRDMFAKIKPTADFENRMKCIEFIKGSGMALASGNIIGLPHQTDEQVADDIMLMKELDISWAPIIPYMPVPGTPLAEEGGRGSLETTLKEISILRIMMPHVNITAQQPGIKIENGLADVDGNLNALSAGANMLFVDMLPASLIDSFNVISHRMIEGMENVDRLLSLSGIDKETKQPQVQ
ncbi:MAG: radical SAM protein [Oscillospiraceae bacterium]|jgi:biotin synthase|nr:radical SAM protein [Oscillospiraceae bacterium]